MCDASSILLITSDFYYIQNVGVPVSTNCAPLSVDKVCFQREFQRSLPSDNRRVYSASTVLTTFSRNCLFPNHPFLKHQNNFQMHPKSRKRCRKNFENRSTNKNFKSENYFKQLLPLLTQPYSNLISGTKFLFVNDFQNSCGTFWNAKR